LPPAMAGAGAEPTLNATTQSAPLSEIDDAMSGSYPTSRPGFSGAVAFGVEIGLRRPPAG
jgi:hypothetical protein